MYDNGMPTPDSLSVYPVYPMVADGEYIFGLVNGHELKEHDIKQMVGGALACVDGIFALKGGLTDVFKRDEDLTRGISVSVSKDGQVSVGAKLITDVTVDPAVIFTDATQRVTAVLEKEAKLRPERLDLEIAESMLEDEFCAKYNEGRVLRKVVEPDPLPGSTDDFRIDAGEDEIE